MSRQSEHGHAADHAAHSVDGAADRDHAGEVRRLVERCGGDAERLRELLHRVTGQLRNAAIREAQRLHGVAFVHSLLAARPAAEHAEGGAHDAPHAASDHVDHPGAVHAAPVTADAAEPVAPGRARKSARSHGADHGDDLHAGQQGPQVVELQQLLKATGYYHGLIGGHFGPATEAALRSFQRDHGLDEDGHANAATLQALRTAAPAAVAVEPGAPAGGTAESPPPASGGAAAVSYGVSVLGAPYAAINPYRFGEVPWPGGAMVDIHHKRRGPFPAGTQVFDCSGFVVACWKHAGVNLLAHSLGSSDSVVNDKGWLIPVTPDQLQPGDLIAHSGHIVMYYGNGQVIQSTPNGGVKISGAGEQLGVAGAVCRRVPV